jgi:hypothetical protein
VVTAASLHAGGRRGNASPSCPVASGTADRRRCAPMNANFRTHPAWRWARRSVIALAGLHATYLLLGNLLLNTGLGRGLANGEPEKFVASWRTAWTLYPGHLRATDVRIAGHTRRTVWSVQADSAHGRVALLPLLSKELHVPQVTATGVTGGASLIDVERLPPPPRPGGWTMRFDSVVADDVHYAYFNDLVLLGKGRGECRFVKVLRGGPMEVLPSHVDFEEGVMWRNDARLAWDARIGARFGMARHLRDEASGIRKLAKTDLTLEIDATTAGLKLEARPGQEPVLRATDGPGILRADVGWHRGSLDAGGHLQLSLPVQADLDGRIESTTAGFELRVTDKDIRLTSGLKPLHDDSISVDADLLVRGTTIPLPDITSLGQRTSGHVVSRWHFDSLAWMDEFLPGSIRVSFDGAGTVLADLKFHDGALDPGSFLEVPHVAATANALGSRFEGDARAKVTFEATVAGQLQPHLEAVMQSFRIAPESAPGQPYVHGRDLRIDAITRGARDDLRDRIQARLWFSDARVPDIRVYNRYLPKTSLQLTGGEGTLSGDLHFDREGAVGKGEFRIVGRAVQLALAGLSLQGDLEIDTKLRRADLKTHSFNADGSRLSLKRVRVTEGSEPLGSEWWGDIELDQARLDWDRPMALDGRLHARMKDVGLLLALYSQRKDLPGWIGRLVDEGEANAQGRVQWQRDTLLLEPFAASNDRFEVLARLRLQEKQPTGDLFAGWGVLSVGVEIAGGQKHYHVVGARKWFDARPSLAAR